VPDDVVGAGRLFDPKRIDNRQAPDRLDRLLDTPRLVGVERQPMFGPDRFADRERTAKVRIDVTATFSFRCVNRRRPPRAPARAGCLG